MKCLEKFEAKAGNKVLLLQTLNETYIIIKTYQECEIAISSEYDSLQIAKHIFTTWIETCRTIIE